MSASGIVVLVAVILGPLLVAGGLLTWWLRRKMAAGRRRMAEQLASEPALRGPESAIYRGSSGGYSQVRGNGQLALTARHVLFVKFVGAGVEVALADVRAVRVAKTFQRSVVGGRVHLILHTDHGDVAFFVTDTDAWVAAIRGAAPHAAAPD